MGDLRVREIYVRIAVRRWREREIGKERKNEGEMERIACFLNLVF